MNDFGLWFGMGMQHILDLDGYDHILFVTLLVIAYPPKEWKSILLLITAFTLGHSVSLALSVSGWLHFSTKWIELLIALTILGSALFQIKTYKTNQVKNNYTLYLIITLFGLIHGLGFSILLRSMLSQEQSSVLPLLYFNLGLELGQVIIVAIVVVFSLFLTAVLKFRFTLFKLILACSIAIIALKISVERFLELFPSSS